MLGGLFRRRSLAGAFGGWLLGTGLGGARAAAAEPPRNDSRTVFEYRALSDWGRLSDLVPTLNKEAVPDGWQVYRIMCSNPDRQPAYHVVLRRAKEGGDLQDDPTVYEYNFLTNFGDLLDMTRRVTREYTPNGWQIFETWWTGPANNLNWHAILRRPVVR